VAAASRALVARRLERPSRELREERGFGEEALGAGVVREAGFLNRLEGSMPNMSSRAARVLEVWEKGRRHRRGSLNVGIDSVVTVNGN